MRARVRASRLSALTTACRAACRVACGAWRVARGAWRVARGAVCRVARGVCRMQGAGYTVWRELPLGFGRSRASRAIRRCRLSVGHNLLSQQHPHAMAC